MLVTFERKDNIWAENSIPGFYFTVYYIVSYQGKLMLWDFSPLFVYAFMLQLFAYAYTLVLLKLVLYKCTHAQMGVQARRVW